MVFGEQNIIIQVIIQAITSWIFEYSYVLYLRKKYCKIDLKK